MIIEPTILGYIAAVCTTCSFVPQVIHTLKTKDTEAISLGMYAFFVFGVSLWLTYGFLVHDMPIILANVITLCLSSTILYLKIKATFADKISNFQSNR